MAQRKTETEEHRSQHGGTIVGFMIGLVLGLAIAVGVAVSITKAPVPFMNKVARATDHLGDNANRATNTTGTDSPDPNRSLSARAKPGAQTTAGTEVSPPLTAPATSPTSPAPVAGIPPPAPIETRTVPAVVASAAPGKADAGADQAVYFLQAGSFSQQGDADAMKARLAMAGYEATIKPADINGQTVLRVRVGPFAQFDDMNNARAKLAENGVSASVVRQK